MFRSFKRAGLLVGVLGVLVATVPAEAQQVNTTVVTTDGQQVSGRNLNFRLDRPQMVLRVSQAEEKQLPVSQVAYVDFGGTPDVNPNISGSQHAVVLRDGSVLKGQMVEMAQVPDKEGPENYLVIIKTTAGEERRLPSTQVARVYFRDTAATTGSGTGTSVTTPAGQGIAVSANQAWTPTGVTVRRGQVLTFNTTGEVQLSTDSSDRAGASGSKSGRQAQNAPLPGSTVGALIGRIGNNGTPFLIGDQTSVTMPASGQLFLGINDDHTADNQGGFRVQVSRSITGR